MVCSIFDALPQKVDASFQSVADGVTALARMRGGHDAVVEGLTAGADHYVVKPFKGKELRARVAAQLAQSEHVRRKEVEAVKSQLQLVLEMLKISAN